MVYMESSTVKAFWDGMAALYITACISDDLHVKDCIGYKQATLVKEGT